LAKAILILTLDGLKDLKNLKGFEKQRCGDFTAFFTKNAFLGIFGQYFCLKCVFKWLNKMC